jgi:hypothetical protein
MNLVTDPPGIWLAHMPARRFIWLYPAQSGNSTGLKYINQTDRNQEQNSKILKQNEITPGKM